MRNEALGMVETRGLIGASEAARHHGESRKRQVGRKRTGRWRFCHCLGSRGRRCGASCDGRRGRSREIRWRIGVGTRHPSPTFRCGNHSRRKFGRIIANGPAL